MLDAEFIWRKRLRVADIHREDDQVDHRVEDQHTAEHQDQDADGVLARQEFQPHAAVSRDALSDDVRHICPPSRLSSPAVIFDGTMDRTGAQAEFD